MKSESGMSFEEAVRVLGLKRGETVDNYRKAFDEVRKHMRRLAEEAVEPEKKANYEMELARFEEALAVAEKHGPKKKRVALLIWSLLILIGLGVGALIWGRDVVELVKGEAARIEAEKAMLPEADEAVAARNWAAAEKIYKEILDVSPRSKAAREGLLKVEEGRETERKQQVFFLLGQAQARMELRSWDAAEDALNRALEMEPDNSQLLAMRERIREGRRVDEIDRLAEEAELARREEQWHTLIAKVNQLEEADPNHVALEELQVLRKEAEAEVKILEEQSKKLYEQALALDQGEYSEEALVLLREAQRLAPSEEAAELYRKMSGYVQTVRVPEDAKTVAGALAMARPGDKVVLGEGRFEESLLLPAGVVLEGVKGKTELAAAADSGSVIVVNGKSDSVRIVGIRFKHDGISNDEERYPVVLVQGGKLILEDCEISFGSGHGLVVTDGGSAELRGTEIKGCGWDGIAVKGEGSFLFMEESRCLANLYHGLDVWSGGKAEVERCRFVDNGLAGVFLSDTNETSLVSGCTIERNRELGVMLAGGVSAELEANVISGNLLGGIIAKDPETTLSLKKNTIQKNGEAGLVIETNAKLVLDEDNDVSENAGKQKWLNADFSEEEEEVPSILKALPVE